MNTDCHRSEGRLGHVAMGSKPLHNPTTDLQKVKASTINILFKTYVKLCQEGRNVRMSHPVNRGPLPTHTLPPSSSWIDRQHRFTSGNTPKTKGGQIYLILATVLWSPWNLNDTKIGFVGVKVFYREHALAYPNHRCRACGGHEAITSTTNLK